MAMVELIERLERAKANHTIYNIHFMVGSLSVMENGKMSLFDSLKTFRLEADIHDVVIRLDDISKVDEFKGGLEIFLKPRCIQRVHEYLQIFNHSIQIKSNAPSPKIEIHFINISDKDKSVLKKFLNMNTIFDVEEPKRQLRPCRKKPPSDDGKEKTDPLFAGPDKKKQKLKNEIECINLVEDDNDQGSRKSTRNRRGKSKGKNGDDPDSINAKEERELEEAIKRSLKATGGGTINLDTPEKKQEFDPYADVDKTIELFRYQFLHGIDGEITVKMEDYLCLGKAEYLSDVIIDFIFSYIYFEKFTDEQRKNIYIFPTSFYSLYATSSDYPGWKSEENANKSAIQKRYERVQGMLDSSVNIFEKEFLVFPLFQNAHWFLAIVCYPNLITNLIYDTNEPTDDELKRNLRRCAKDPDYNPIPLKTSCILSFDSVRSNPARQSTAKKHIYNFLLAHHEMHYKDSFEMGKLSGCQIPVPSQSNNFDCGCFIIEFFERFFVTDPVRDFRLPISKKNWFDSKAIRLGKRREIVEIIKDKMKIYAEMKGTDMPELPELMYYSEKIIDLDNDDGKEKKDENNGNEENNNNNNDEVFNNNNDFNCVDSNQVVPVSSSESVTKNENAEEAFNRLQRSSYRNMHSNDDKNATKKDVSFFTGEASSDEEQVGARKTEKVPNGSAKNENSAEGNSKHETINSMDEEPVEITSGDENSVQIPSQDQKPVEVASNSEKSSSQANNEEKVSSTDIDGDIEMKETEYGANIEGNKAASHGDHVNEVQSANLSEDIKMVEESPEIIENCSKASEIDEKMECDDNDSKQVEEEDLRPQNDKKQVNEEISQALKDKEQVDDSQEMDEELVIPPFPLKSPETSQIDQETESSQEIPETQPKCENRSKIVDDFENVKVEESCDSQTLATD